MAHRLRRWPNIVPTLAERSEFFGIHFLTCTDHSDGLHRRGMDVLDTMPFVPQILFPAEP